MSGKNKASQRSKRYIQVTPMELAILVYSIAKSDALDEIGFEDAWHTQKELRAKLSINIGVPLDLVESCLWACNMLDEHEIFEHPDGIKFDTFVRNLLPDHLSFDKIYNIVEHHVKEK